MLPALFVLVGLLLGTVVGVGLMLTGVIAQSTTSVDAPSVMDTRPHAKGSPAAVLAAHPDCWTNEATMPAEMRGQIPGHVIWQHANGQTVYSAKLVGPALDTLPGGDGELAGQPIAFCK